MAQMPAVNPTQAPSRFKRLMTSIAISRPGTWFYINVASRVDPWLIRATRGRIDSSMRVVPIVLMTARGAKSGVERTVPLLYFTERDDVILMASSFGRPHYPAWYHNLKAHPEVRLYRHGRIGSYVAHEVDNAERDRLYQLAKQLYAGYGIYEGRVAGVRQVPVLRLSPDVARVA